MLLGKSSFLTYLYYIHVNEWCVCKQQGYLCIMYRNEIGCKCFVKDNRATDLDANARNGENLTVWARPMRWGFCYHTEIDDCLQILREAIGENYKKSWLLVLEQWSKWWPLQLELLCNNKPSMDSYSSSPLSFFGLLSVHWSLCRPAPNFKGRINIVYIVLHRFPNSEIWVCVRRLLQQSLKFFQL